MRFIQFFFLSIVMMLSSISLTAELALDVDGIPDQFSQQLILREPTGNWVTTRPTVMVQGQNAFLGKVFVNGVDVGLHNDGRFSHEVTLPAVGKNVIYVSFVLPDFRVYTIERRVLYLAQPKGYESLAYNTEILTTVFNSGVVGPKTMALTVSEVLRLDHLSETVVQLKALHADGPVTGDAQPVALSHYMDGRYDPELRVTSYSFWSAIADTLDLPPTTNIEGSPYLDLSYDWQKARIQPLVDAGILPGGAYFYPESEMTVEHALNALHGVPAIQERVAALRDFSEGYATNNAVFVAHAEVVSTYQETEQAVWSSQQKLTIASPEVDQISLSDHVRFVGQVYPPRSFRINAFEIVPELNGQFYQEMPLLYGENKFDIQPHGEPVHRSVFRLKGYPDLAGHWFELTAAKLRWLDLLPAGDRFDSQSTITRLEFAQILNRFFNLEDVIMTFSISDTPADVAVSRVVGNKILSVSKAGEFFPHDTVSRLKAVAAIVESGNFGGKLFQEPIAFKDVSREHWGYSYLERAVHNELVRREAQFFPDRAITKAELYALLSRLPSVQKLFKETWP